VVVVAGPAVRYRWMRTTARDALIQGAGIGVSRAAGAIGDGQMRTHAGAVALVSGTAVRVAWTHGTTRFGWMDARSQAVALVVGTQLTVVETLDTGGARNAYSA